MSPQDPSHNPHDVSLTQTQHRAMPKVTKPDECSRKGIVECHDESCPHYNQDCPLSDFNRRRPSA
jgi:hypothetical protein